MENVQQESIQQTPRLIRNKDNKVESYLDKFIQKGKQLFEYKQFRYETMQLVRMMNKDNEDLLKINFISEYFPIIMLNTLGLTYYINRKKSMFMKASWMVFFGSFTYLSTAIIAEEQIFYQIMIRQSFQTYYIRRKMPSHKYTNYLCELNQKFEQQYDLNYGQQVENTNN